MRTLCLSLIAIALSLYAMEIKAQQMEHDVNKKLQKTTTRLLGEFDQISDQRKEELEELGDFMVENMEEGKKFGALFVCTHNSRRSHLADLWFKYGTFYFGLNQFESFSGGTEATAFNAKAIEAVKRAGFSVVYDKKADNPVVSISPANYPVWMMQSKVYTHDINPKENFVAVMVCSDADKSCPAVDGAEGRFPIPYNDPRHSDGTPSEKDKYDETVSIIGREMLFMVDHMKKQIVVMKESSR